MVWPDHNGLPDITCFLQICICTASALPWGREKNAVVSSLSRVWLFLTPWIAAHQASLSITNSWSLLKLMPVESVMPSNHLILCCPLLLLPSISSSIKVFSSELTLHIRWPKDWSFLKMYYFVAGNNKSTKKLHFQQLEDSHNAGVSVIMVS